MGRAAFTRAEAQAKIGTWIRPPVPFVEVHRGAMGTMTGVDWVIRWL